MPCRKSDSGGIEGSEFQLKAALLLLLRYMKEYGTNFELSAENPEGGSFDDLVIKFRDENGNERYILIQLKHKKNEAQTITYYDLLQQPKGNFNLLKYLESFEKISKSAGSEEKIQDMIIFTNLNLSEEILEKYVEEKASTKTIFSFASSAEFVKKPKLYKLNQTFIDDLEHCKLRILAEKILHCGFKKRPLRESYYHEVLAADVFNVADNKFKDDFLSNSNTQEETKILRKIIEQVFIAKYKSPIGFEDIHSLPSDQFELKLSSEFGNGENNSIFWPENTILSNDTCNSFKEFAKYLVLAVDQPNEKQLEPFIREEIGHLSNLESTALDIAPNLLIKDITDWYKEDYVRYLNSQDGISYLNKIKQQITEIISRESFISTYSNYCNIMDELNIKFQDTSSDGKLQSFLASDSSVSIIVDESECFILNSIKLYESMRRLKLPHYLFHATRLHALQSEDIVKLIDFFETSTLYNLLVLELDVDLSAIIIFRLIKILTENKKKKMILVSKGQFSGISCFNQIIPVTVEAAPQYSFDSFTHECRNYLLEKSVDFQGTPCVLNDLIPLADAGQIFKGKLLIQLIEFKDFVISRNGESSIGYNRKTYINRFVVCREPIINSLDIDAIGVDSIANTEEEYHEKCRTQKNVHLLIPRKDGNYLWKQSQGNYSQFQKYLVVFRDEDREHLISSRTFIIADSAGTGKSTIFSHLTNHLKSGYPHNWIQYIDLNKYTAKFEKAIKEGRQLDENNLLHFLAVELMSLETELEMEVFKYYFEKGEKLFLLFDAFDEISPQYTELVMKMFIILQRTPLKFLGITTRPHLRALLEEDFNTINTLQPFSPSDQIQFLKRRWMEGNNLAASDIIRVCEFANKIINEFSSKVNDENSIFFGVPFQTMMIADIYEEKVIENLKNEICNPQFETYDVIDLYEIFIRTKYEKQLKEKFGMDSSKPGFESMLKGLMEVNNKRHKEYALSTVFKDDIKLDFHADDKEVEEILRIGILTKQNDGLVFIHKTFAEYFVSQHLTEANNWNADTIEMIIRPVFWRPKYKVVLIFMNQLLKKKERNEMLKMAESFAQHIRFGSIEKKKFLQMCFNRLIVHNYCHILRLIFLSWKFLPKADVMKLIGHHLPIILNYKQAEILEILIEVMKSQVQPGNPIIRIF